MVKDTVSKKRKSNVETDAEVDVYKKIVEHEEKEALQRSSETDAEIYFEICKRIRGLLANIFLLKSEHKKENKTEIIKKRTEACVLTTHLKKLNRFEKVRMMHTRESLTQEKQKLDSINLQYQNLLYEQAHLNSELEKCKQYKSKDEEIELISTEEFLRVGPSDVTSKFKNKTLDTNLSHELHLAMLEHELNQRIELSNLCGTLENQKKQLAKDIVQRKEKLEGLGPRLAAVIEATKPLQDQLGLPIDKIRAEHKLASLLPDELYLLYCNGDSYKQVNDIGMSIEILGDQEEAVQYNETENNSNDPESEPDVEPQEEVVETKKRRHRKVSVVDKYEEKKKKLVEPHPLSVEISMTFKDGPSLKIKFLHRTALKIVTVTSTVEIPSNITGNSSREVLCGESVLNELFENDFGKDSPNPSNNYQLKKVGFGSYESLVSKLGYAYVWAQKICGLDFMDTQNFKDKTNKLSQNNMENVLRTIQKRLKARFALAEQLQQLVNSIHTGREAQCQITEADLKCMQPVDVRAYCLSLTHYDIPAMYGKIHAIEQNCISIIPDTVEYPKTAVSTLTKWSSISYQKFCQDTPNAQTLVEMDIAGSNDLFYSVTIARPKAVLCASIIIKNDYPMRSPIFVLCLKFNGEHNSKNSDEIRDMERAVNIGWEQNQSTAGWLLSAQLRYLCSFLDVYLETSEGSGFTQSTVFFRNVCARNRRRPFKFRKIGSGIFTQY